MADTRPVSRTDPTMVLSFVRNLAVNREYIQQGSITLYSTNNIKYIDSSETVR